jgi:hypothetical protein
VIARGNRKERARQFAALPNGWLLLAKSKFLRVGREESHKKGC